jgi:hypothetical protein
MKVKYPKSRIQNNFIYGLLMVGVGIFAVYINSSSIFSYLWIFVGILQTGTAFYQKKHQYLTIRQDKLIKHSIIPKSVEISEIKRVRKFVNSYRIETTNGSLLIEKSFVEEESLQELNHFLENLSPSLAT